MFRFQKELKRDAEDVSEKTRSGQVSFLGG